MHVIIVSLVCMFLQKIHDLCTCSCREYRLVFCTCHCVNIIGTDCSYWSRELYRGLKITPWTEGQYATSYCQRLHCDYTHAIMNTDLQEGPL